VSQPPPGPPPIPPGTFRIDRDGAWRHEGQEVSHPGVVRNLYANLRADATGHYLQVGPSRIPVDVEDAPFVVIRAETSPSPGVTPSSVRLHLTDGTDEVLDPASLWIGPAGAPYCRVKGGAFVARFALAAWLQLAAVVEEDPASGAPTLVLGGRRLPVPRRSA
jgi:uncharacterized protein